MTSISVIGYTYEIITDEELPYSYDDINWRAGNYIQSLFIDSCNLPALSENFIGKGILNDTRNPDLCYPADTGRALVCYVEEALYTPIVRLDLVKRIFKAIYDSRYPDAPSLQFAWSVTKRQTTYIQPCKSVVKNYPESKLITRILPDTSAENVALVGFRIKTNDVFSVSGGWYDESKYNYKDVKDNEYDSGNGSYSTVREYISDKLPAVTIIGKGWDGDRDMPLEINIISPDNSNRQNLQLVISNFTDANMGFSAPYPCKLPETIQLPDKTEISSKQWSVNNPAYQYIIIYTKDASNSGFEYQNAMLFVWESTVASVTVEWVDGKYKAVYIDYIGTGVITKKVWLARFQGVDPSVNMNHIHRIANNILMTGKIGMGIYMPYESSWMEEPVGGMPAAAYLLCKYDKEEDQFGGDYADTSRQIATKLMDDRIAMWNRGRKCSNAYEFVTGACYLSLLYKLPGKYFDKKKSDYYKDWAETFAKHMIAKSMSGGRVMQALWRVYELTNNSEYSDYYESLYSQYSISSKTGLGYNGGHQNPRDFYMYGDFIGALGRRGLPEDRKDIQSLITYLTDQHRWVDTGYMGWWWEVTVENETYFGRCAKGLNQEKLPKTIVSVSQFPKCVKKGNEYVVEFTTVPPIYNPNYWDKEVMNNYLPLLPHKIAKSIIFRIENILVKTDYPNDFWVGTKDQSVIDVLNSIKNKIQIILKYIDDGTVKTANYENTTKLLSECFSLWDSMELKAKQPKGNANDIQGELFYAKSNLEYLRNVLK